MSSAAIPVVFVVDDDVSYHGFLKRLIESAGWQSETFASAREFLKMNARSLPELVNMAAKLGPRIPQVLAKAA